MPFDVEAADNGLYLAHEYSSDWKEVWSSDQSPRDELFTLLISRGHHQRDVIECFDAAEKSLDRGRSDVERQIRRIWRKSVRGEKCTGEELDFVRSELSNNAENPRRTYLIQILHRTGNTAEAEEEFLKIARDSDQWDDVEISLNLLSDWYPSAFARVAPGFIRGLNKWQSERHVRGWAMFNATNLLLKKQHPSLFDDILHTATDQAESPLIRLAATRQIARLAEGPSDDPLSGIQDDNRDLKEDVKRARQYLSRASDAPGTST